MSRVHQLSRCLCVGLVVLPGLASGQTSTAPVSERTPLRFVQPKETPPHEERGLGTLLKEVTTLKRQVDIQNELLTKAAQSNDGTSQGALRVNYIALAVGRDEARLRSKVTASVEAARHEMADQAATLQLKLEDRTLELAQTNERVRELADRVVKASAGGNATTGHDQIEHEGDELELLGMARLAAAQQADESRLLRLTLRCADELESLDLVDARLASLARVQRIETERRLDAIKNESQMLETRDLLERGKMLGEIVQALGVTRKPMNGAVPNSGDVEAIEANAPLKGVIKGLPQVTLSPEDRRLLDTILKEAVQRRDKVEATP